MDLCDTEEEFIHVDIKAKTQNLEGVFVAKLRAFLSFHY